MSQKYFSKFAIQEISQLKKEIEKFKNEAAKTRPAFAKMESELKEELAEERRKVADLENRLNSEATSMRQKDEIIETQNQVEYF